MTRPRVTLFIPLMGCVFVPPLPSCPALLFQQRKIFQMQMCVSDRVAFQILAHCVCVCVFFYMLCEEREKVLFGPHCFECFVYLV